MLHLIWDLDGTLIDSEKEIVETIKSALVDADIDLSNTIRPFRIGPALEQVLKNSFGAYLTEEKLEKVVSAFRKRYDSSSFLHTLPFTGIDDIIHDTNSYTHYIVTNKPDIPSKKIIDKLGWKNKISAVLTPYTLGAEKKTKEQLFSYLLASEKLHTEYSYAIGDMAGDCSAAQSAGLKTIGVLWGTGTKEELLNNTYLCSTVSELKDLLKQLCKK